MEARREAEENIFSKKKKKRNQNVENSFLNENRIQQIGILERKLLETREIHKNENLANRKSGIS